LVGRAESAPSSGVTGVADELSYLLCVPPRSQHVPLSGAHNFRDLGGYPAGDRRVRWGRLYRSDALHRLTVEDVTTLRGLGLRWIVDLRPPGEAAGTGRGRMAAESVGYLNLPASRDDDRRPDAAAEDVEAEDELVGRYLSYLEAGGNAFVGALHHMADADRYPMVFHCFFGKDRSGVLAALVLGCLEVDRQAIVDDYARSHVAMGPLLASLAVDPVYRDAIARTPPSRLAASAATMDRFLQRLDARYGGAAGWALGAGIPADEIETLRRLLLE
jgi:protein tyrosine/serine phosphatase